MGGQGDTRLQRTASVTVARLRSSPAISPRRMRERDEARLGVIILAAAASARPRSRLPKEFTAWSHRFLCKIDLGLAAWIDRDSRARAMGWAGVRAPELG